MSRSATLRFVSVLLLMVAGLTGGLASAAHVTDKLVVGVYAEPGGEGSPLRLVSSGTPLEVLSRKDAYAEVRLADDTKGWIDASYVTDEKPAKAMLLETQAKLRQMGIELASLRERAGESGGASDAPPPSPVNDAAPTAREAQLRQSLSKAEARVAELEAELAEVPRDQAARVQLDELRARTGEALRVLADAQGLTLNEVDTAAEQDLLSRYQDWIIAIAALVLGFAAGVAFIDYRIRKRYGGFRI